MDSVKNNGFLFFYQNNGIVVGKTYQSGVVIHIFEDMLVILSFELRCSLTEDWYDETTAMKRRYHADKTSISWNKDFGISLEVFLVHFAHFERVKIRDF